MASMRNVVGVPDPTKPGSLAGTLTKPATTTDVTATPAAPVAGAAPATQGQATPNPDGTPEALSEDDWYQLLHSLGSAMTKANPDIQKAIQQANPNVDWEKEMAALQGQVKARPVTPQMPWYQAAAASVRDPYAAAEVQQHQRSAAGEASQKQADLEKIQEEITMGHIGDLQKRGKFQEALATMLLQKGITEGGARTRAQEKLQQEKLKGENAVNAVRERANRLADTFHFDERMRLKLLDVASKVASAKLQKYGGLDPVYGGFSVKPEDYEKWQDETMGEIYRVAGQLHSGVAAGGTGEVETPAVPGTTVQGGGKGKGKPTTSHGQSKPDPLGLR